MAYRYRTRTPENGDIADPRDLMENLAALVGEFNGGLDADNIPEKAISSSQILVGAFTNLVSSAITDDVNFAGETTEWRSVNGDGGSVGTTLHELTITNNTDTLLEVEWSATWTRQNFHEDDEAAAFRILVNGTEIARCQRSPRSRAHDHTYLVGTAPVQGGETTVTVQIKQWEDGTDKAHGHTTTVKERELIIRAYKR